MCVFLCVCVSFSLYFAQYTFDLWECVREFGINDIHVKVIVKACPMLGMHVVVFPGWIGKGLIDGLQW